MSAGWWPWQPGWVSIPARRPNWFANPNALASALTPAFEHLPRVEADTIAVGKPIAFYRDWLAHSRSDDPYWDAIDHATRVPQIAAPAHLVTGWHDFFVHDILADYAALEAAGREPYLTIGPEGHGMQGAMASLEPGLTWFDAHLKGDRSRLREKPVRIYVMGADEWREMDSWPPSAQETRFFLHAEGRLSTERPEANSPPDHYRYDPADPTPSVGGPSLTATTEPVDNRELEARPDVLVYPTPPLAADVDVVGPVRLELYVRSSLAHTDFFGRLCDVRPDGRSLNVCDGLSRIAPGKGEPQPDGSLRIEVDMWATAKRFSRGHSIRLQVSSGAHPRWSRNLGTGEPLATGTTMTVADQAVYHDDAHPSALVLPIVMDR